MDLTNLKYTITKFDPTAKQLDVQFDDGSWAHIQLRTPLPTNQQELEDIIRQFAASVEVVEAKTADVDLSFVNNLVNTQQTTQRYSITNPTGKPDPNAPISGQMPPQMPSPDEIKQMQNNQKIQFQYNIADFLVQQGILKTNPVDLTQIKSVVPPATQTQPVTQGLQTL